MGEETETEIENMEFFRFLTVEILHWAYDRYWRSVADGDIVDWLVVKFIGSFL